MQSSVNAALCNFNATHSKVKMQEDVFEITEDLMLDGLKIIQDKRYYRFTSDSILLSRFPQAKNGEKVADFCAGSGIVGLHFYGLNKNSVKSVTLFELQPELCNLAQKNIELNGLNDVFTLQQGKLQDSDKSFNGCFSLILCNPPYKKKNSGEQGLSKHIAVCRHECEITLDEIIFTAARMLEPSGRFCICQRIERLTDLLCGLRAAKLEPFDMAFVCASTGEPYLVIVQAVKGKKPQLKVRKDIINRG